MSAGDSAVYVIGINKLFVRLIRGALLTVKHIASNWQATEYPIDESVPTIVECNLDSCSGSENSNQVNDVQLEIVGTDPQLKPSEIARGDKQSRGEIAPFYVSALAFRGDIGGRHQ